MVGFVMTQLISLKEIFHGRLRKLYPQRPNLIFEPVREKTNNSGSDQVRHKPVFTVTEDG